MMSVQVPVLPAQTGRDAFSTATTSETQKIVTMDIKQEGGHVKKEQFIFGPLLGAVR